MVCDVNFVSDFMSSRGYIIVVVVCLAVNAMLPVCVGLRQEAVGMRRGGFSVGDWCDGCSPCEVLWYVLIFNRRMPVKLDFF